MATESTQRRYKVRLSVSGDVERVISATSEDDALRKAKQLLFESDGQTPKAKMLQAFCWDFDRDYIYPLFSDLTEEERANLAKGMDASCVSCLATSSNEEGAA